MVGLLIIDAPAPLPQDKLGSHVKLRKAPRNPTEPNRIPGIRQQRQWTMNQAVKRWVAVKPRPQSVLVVVSTGAVGWARMRLNQAVKRWVAVEPRPQSAQIIALALFARARSCGHMVADGSGDVVGFCLVRSTKGNGSFRTRASGASPSLRGCVRVRACVRVA